MCNILLIKPLFSVLTAAYLDLFEYYKNVFTVLNKRTAPFDSILLTLKFKMIQVYAKLSAHVSIVNLNTIYIVQVTGTGNKLSL